MLLATKQIFCGQKIWLACDSDCAHAWGMNWHGEKGDTAPTDPGTYEGEHGKPASLAEAHNKWCARECERCQILARGDYDDDMPHRLVRPRGAEQEGKSNGN